MKMGNIASPWRYDESAYCALRSSSLRRPVIAIRAGAFPLSVVRFCHDPLVAQCPIRKVWDGETPKQFRSLDFAAALDLLSGLNVAKTLQDLSPLRSVGLHKLKGDRAGQWALTVNARWRTSFSFRKGDAHDVEIVDYHRG
jgi:proteic killer suppression protein